MVWLWDNDGWLSTRRLSLEAHMGTKNKGGRAPKKVGKDLKQKRLDKKAKRAAATAKSSREV